MNIHRMYRLRQRKRARVIAFHCSGAGAGEWRALAEALGSPFEVDAPEFYGCESAGMWSGEHAFTLADEAARAIELIDRGEGKVHLVGHSYGGGVALHVAIARPERIASMALYEPSAFHLLSHMGEDGREARAEIARVARRICEGIVTGDYRGGMSVFVDYWNGAGAWEALAPAVQHALVRWAPKASLDFHALLGEPTLPSAYRQLRGPVLLLHGEHAPMPALLIADGLSKLLPESQLVEVAGADHMGPLTHAAEVCALIARHIAASELQLHQQRGGHTEFPGATPPRGEAAP
jgi:pimeloyl-ACP methyl ester carboxylesterase